MKRMSGPKVIQISGVRGIFLAIFTVVCLFAGFVMFPAKISMYAWNYIGSHYIALPAINLGQGVLLWIMVALSIYLLNNKQFAISFHQPMELSEDEMRVLMSRIKAQRAADKFATMVLSGEELRKILADKNATIEAQNTIKKDETKEDEIAKP